MKKTIIKAMWMGVVVVMAGCASDELLKPKTVNADVPAPEPGTQAYYEQKIKGNYAIDGGELLAMPSTATPSRPLVRSTGSPGLRPLPSGIRLPGGSASPRWTEGRVLQIVSTNMIALGKAVTNASGAVTFPQDCLVKLNGRKPTPSQGDWFRAPTMPDGDYSCTVEEENKDRAPGTRSNILGQSTSPGFRELAEPTYEEYRQVYERDFQAAKVADPLVFVERITNAPTAPTGRPTPGRSTFSRPTTPTPAPAPPRPEASETSVGTNGLYIYTVNAAGQAAITGFDKAFSGVLAVTNVLGGSPVTEIGKNAFAGCQKITELILPESLVAIGDSAFNGCSQLVDVKFPAGLLSIGNRAFQNCRMLASVSIPDSVTTIEEAAFEFCHSLTEVRIPVGVAVMGGNPFGGCPALRTLTVDPGNSAFMSDSDGVVFSKDKTEIVGVPGAIQGAYAIPAGVTNILRGAFLICPGLTSVQVPSSVKRIGTCAFWICSNLKEVSIAEGVERIGTQAFESCGKLETITLPASVRHLDSWAFRNASGLRSIHFLGDVPIGAGNTSLFHNCPDATVYYRPGTQGWGETFGGRPVKVWEKSATSAGTPPDVGTIADLKRAGAFGFPQAEAQVLCDTPELRASFWSDAKFMVVQAIVWKDGGETLKRTPDGREIGDWSNLMLDVDADQKESPNTDRKYSLNPWPSLSGLHYQIRLGSGSSTSIKGDTEGRGSIRYVSVEAGNRVRVDTFAIPLEEIGKQPGDRIRLAYWACSQEPEMTLDSVGSGLGGVYYSHHLPWNRHHDVVLGKSLGFFDVHKMPDGKADAATPSSVRAAGGNDVRREVANSLQIGDPAPPLAQGKYVQGEPVAGFEKGKAYVVEFWATWCGPCRTVIPHVNKLQEKYKDKGLVVIGQNVWQRGENVESDVTAFVKQMGAEMTYRVALDRDGTMAETWMKAAGRKGIPAAFVVDREGKIAWIGHPSSGLDEAVEKALAD